MDRLDRLGRPMVSFQSFVYKLCLICRFCHDCTASNTNLAATIDRSFALQKPLQRKRKSLDTSSVEDLSRPKRSAALNRPDYHALHHHIATPTARWLDLIKDPQKYGTVIVEGAA